ncbi:MAG: copper amine oxidase N-terminal domain-containing protein, partial [Clostridia bacterium]|nr:copper amine oxidase N-terminal domain-containing protein [Clostridia bacterium]
VNNRTLLPIRAVIEAMGGTVAWDGSTKTVTLSAGGKELFLRIDSKAMWDAVEVYFLDTAPVIIGGRTMLPVRAVAEYFGATVSWDAGTKTTTIEYYPQ